MKKGIFGCLMLLVIPLTSHAQYPMYGSYPYRPVAPYGPPSMGFYPMGMGMYAPPAMMAQPTIAPQSAPMQPIPGYTGPRATPANPTQLPNTPSGGPVADYPSFDVGALGAPPAPAPDPRDLDDLNPRMRRPDRFWVSADYAPVFIRQGPLSVPLVTVGSPLDLAPAAIGSPGTTVVFGNKDLDFSRLDGIRGGAGIWFDTESHLGLEILGMYVQPGEVRFRTASDNTGKPVIGLPAFVTNAQPGDPPAEAAFRIAMLDEAAGSVRVDAQTQYWTAEMNARFQDYFSPVTRGSWLLGVRTARLEESLNINSQLTVLANGQYFFRGDVLNPGDGLAIRDSFSTVNQFYGLQTGGLWALDIDRFFLELHGKLAVGVTHQQVRIDGSTTYTPVGAPPRASLGGFLAQNSNMDTYNRYQFSFLPEAGVNLGVNLLDCLRLRGGYTFSVWTDVTRPGQAIDRRLDTIQVPVAGNFAGQITGDPAPLFKFQDQLLWLHVFNVGLEFHY